jgi:hypothetical protein
VRIIRTNNILSFSTDLKNLVTVGKSVSGALKLPKFYKDRIDKIGNYKIYKNVNFGSLG